VPELPDIAVYFEALAPRVLQQPLERLRIVNPFLVRTPEPPIAVAEGRTVVALRRMGKRMVFALEGDLFLVLHLMIAGRLRWHGRGA
jgi:formamidopyrimidine-DNA glycosylase